MKSGCLCLSIIRYFSGDYKLEGWNFSTFILMTIFISPYLKTSINRQMLKAIIQKIKDAFDQLGSEALSYWQQREAGKLVFLIIPMILFFLFFITMICLEKCSNNII